MKIKATTGRLVVMNLPDDKKTSGGIYLSRPSTDLHSGTIVSVGPKGSEYEFDFKLGDIAYWQNYSGTEYIEDGNSFTIINKSDIIAVSNE